MSVEGRGVLVTGASGGIGSAVVERLRADGALVVGFDLPGTGADVEGDVTSASDMERAVAEVEARHGGLDAVVNNAGIEGVVRPIAEYPEDVFDRVLAVNVKGVWLGIKAAVPALQRRGGGAIVNVSSVAGLGPAQQQVAYGASKHAAIGITLTAAAELAGLNIRVNAVCPSPAETRMMRSIEAGFGGSEAAAPVVHDAIAAMIPLGRYASPADVAGVIRFLVSSDADFVTGAIYTVDGGWSART